MQINHNIRAMVTQQSLFQNDNSMTKSLEKLSTGLRINRAQDDAAGLAMSEQMRTQIRGLGKAKRNAQDGQAALQIAEGALGEITNMMQRQKELAVQSASDTLTSTERMYLNDEFQALTKEINRIANNTDYNGKNVLLFDADPNKSFGATKLDPYNKEVSFLNAANVIYKYFGQDLKGGFASLTVSYKGTVTDSTPGSTQVNALVDKLNKTLQSYAPAGILTDTNIASVLKAFSNIGKDLNSIGGATTGVALGLGKDLLHTDTVSYMTSVAKLNAGEQTASNMKTLQSLNNFLRGLEDAYTAYKAAEKGEFKIKEGAFQNVSDIFSNLAKSDIKSVAGALSSTPDSTGVGSLDRIVSQLKTAYGNLTAAEGLISTAGVDDKATQAKVASMWANLSSVFGSKASAQMQNDLKAVLEIDASKMATGKIKDSVMTWQKAIGDLKDAYKTYSQADISTGTAASEVLHVGPNYSTGLGGGAANQIKVNYVAVDVKGLGLEAQTIDSREGAQKAIDKLQETIKVISGNRAAIGTYINRLDYTVNNIASMEYNIQDAESRIRDTDFATETTNFTKNQIMVQASTSMLAQANSLPQSVLGLIG